MFLLGQRIRLLIPFPLSPLINLLIKLMEYMNRVDSLFT